MIQKSLYCSLMHKDTGGLTFSDCGGLDKVKANPDLTKGKAYVKYNQRNTECQEHSCSPAPSPKLLTP